VDPESPESLFKFLADIESLGAGGRKGGRNEETESTGKLAVGLRVSGSKKSWKRYIYMYVCIYEYTHR
jgi:hypothetical protein